MMGQQELYACKVGGMSDRLTLTAGTRGTIRLSKNPVFLVFLALGSASWMTPQAGAGLLIPSQPIVESQRYVVPVHLVGAESAVTALDFQMDFDAAGFVPVSVETGTSAIAANKMVNANLTGPGTYRVVVMGLNQNPIPAGEVARVILQRTQSSGTPSPFQVNDPTLARADGSKEPAEGGGIAVEPDSDGAAPDQPDTPAQDEIADEPDVPEAPNNDRLSEESTEEIMDMVLGALDAPKTEQTGPGGLRMPPGAMLAGEPAVERPSLRNGTWAKLTRAESAVPVVTKQYPDSSGEAIQSNTNAVVPLPEQAPAEERATDPASLSAASDESSAIKRQHMAARVEYVSEAARDKTAADTLREAPDPPPWAGRVSVVAVVALAALMALWVWRRVNPAKR